MTPFRRNSNNSYSQSLCRGICRYTMPFFRVALSLGAMWALCYRHSSSVGGLSSTTRTTTTSATMLRPENPSANNRHNPMYPQPQEHHVRVEEESADPRHHESLRGGPPASSSTTTTADVVVVSEEPPQDSSTGDQEELLDAQLDQQNALLNPLQCPLPPHCRIIEIPVEPGSPLPNGTTLTSFKLAVWPPGDFVSDRLATDKAWEIKTLQDMAALTPSRSLPLPEDGVVYDVGANVGYYSFLLAAHGYSCIAVEPEPGNVALLRASACLNPLLKVEIVAVALTNAEESHNMTCRLSAEATLRTQKYLHAIERLTCTTTTNATTTPPACHASLASNEICVDHVPVTTLAELIHQYTTTENGTAPPAIVKVDVEGHDLKVLQGLLLLNDDHHYNTTTGWRPSLIQFENKDPRVSPALTALLESAGYVVGTARGHDQNTMAELQTIVQPLIQ